MTSLQDRWLTKLLAGASIVALTSIAPVAFAQDTPADDEDAFEDEVIVTGFKSSLQRAQDIKLNADTFVDAITSEDIGALPDRSVAEALQRVPGVNISRFAAPDDPDRFSVEGSSVVIRGLPFVRSELNGRDIFSANGGRSLSFNDVSPELLGAVEVFKNTTADMVDGGIAGTVNLKTRKPLDNPGPRFAATIEGNYGDMAEEWSPGGSFLISNTVESNAGTVGLQLGFAASELVSRTDVSQITDPCYRDAALNGPCLRARAVGSGGVGGDTNFNETNFPPAGSVLVPKGAGIRTNTFERNRQALSLIGQYESPGGNLLATLEYLRADADQMQDEFSVLALVNDDALFPIPTAANDLQFDANGIFQSGTLTQAGPGIPTENLRFNRVDEAKTEDISFDLKWNPMERLALNFEIQRINSTRNEDGIIGALQSYSDIFIDNSGDQPDVQFIPSTGAQGGLNSGSDVFYWFLIDNQVRNTGKLTSYRADADYDFKDKVGPIKSVRFGARWAERNRVTRNANFSNWGNLSAPWLGSAIYADNAAGLGAAQSRTPFTDFQRGNVAQPIPGGSALFFGSDDFVGDYLSGLTFTQADSIGIAWENTFGFWNRAAFGPFPNLWQPLTGLPTSDVSEDTLAFYGRADFEFDNFDNGWVIDGNFGLRYVETSIQTIGEISFPQPGTSPDPTVFCNPATLPPGATLPGFCNLPASRVAEYNAFFSGDVVDDSDDVEFENWLPSFNAKLDIGDGIIFRGAVSKGLSRPDLGAFATGGLVFDNTTTLQQAGTLDSAPLFKVFTGNRLLVPIESWNFDLSAEWYFDDVGSLTVSAFYKDLSQLITQGVTEREFALSTGQNVRVEFEGPANADSGSLHGFEVAYQQTFDFLPGALDGLGVQATYTYVDGEQVPQSDNGIQRQPFAGLVGFPGISQDTINLTGFYENDLFSARLAYNWRSEFAVTARDVIFPFSPIIGESTGQLDGSFFYNVTDNLKLGVQGVNLLDEVTETSQVINFQGDTVRRSGIRNDRRFSVIARVNF
ncbi:TonB-dependent receptor [Algimonas porphyrae]|uniref:TonB-dependent receptor n=1 Tax=Algimonas porphyrae TaxID=1128113 RepID=A0ABQ5V353_9PROT|nr:TonB-dependent receptor [Algimonas porphyrae]GLQ21407.1 TonB-dependent receptor [Algimonas porphyrae]